jgi:hypothetical protein
LRKGDWNIDSSSTVIGRGDTICRQLKKYGFACGVRHVSCCDGESAVFLRLEGDTQTWYNEKQEGADATPAYARFISFTGEIKRNLFVFLREALLWKLREYRLVQ